MSRVPFSYIATATFVGLLAWPVGARAQAIFDEGRALEFSTDVPFANMQLEGRERIVGVSPLRVPGALEGEFWLSGWSPGVELQRGRIRIALDAGGSSIASYGSRSFSETLLYGLIYPGIVQHQALQRGKGRFLGISAALAVGGTLWAQSALGSDQSDVEAADRAIAAASDPTVREELKKDRQDRKEERDFAADRRNIFLAATGAVWGIGLLDAFLFSPGFHVTQVDESSLTIQLRSKTRTNALLRSLVFPGLGQEYNGQGTKAAWIALGGMGATGYVMYRQNEYAASIRDFDIAHERFEAATTVEDRNKFGLAQQRLFATVEDREGARNTAIMVLGAYWSLVMIETAFSFGDGWGSQGVSSPGVGLNVDPAQGQVAAQWTF